MGDLAEPCVSENPLPTTPDEVTRLSAEVQRLRSNNARMRLLIEIAKDIVNQGPDYEPGLIDEEYSEGWHDKLRALVARLREPAGLVWRRDGGVLRSQKFNYGFYEVQTAYFGGFYPTLCAAKTEERILTGASADAGTEEAAKAACDAHRLARYHEMQKP